MGERGGEVAMVGVCLWECPCRCLCPVSMSIVFCCGVAVDENETAGCQLSSLMPCDDVECAIRSRDRDRDRAKLFVSLTTALNVDNKLSGAKVVHAWKEGWKVHRDDGINRTRLIC